MNTESDNSPFTGYSGDDLYSELFPNELQQYSQPDWKRIGSVFRSISSNSKVVINWISEKYAHDDQLDIDFIIAPWGKPIKFDLVHNDSGSSIMVRDVALLSVCSDGQTKRNLSTSISHSTYAEGKLTVGIGFSNDATIYTIGALLETPEGLCRISSPFFKIVTVPTSSVTPDSGKKRKAESDREIEKKRKFIVSLLSEIRQKRSEMDELNSQLLDLTSKQLANLSRKRDLERQVFDSIEKLFTGN
jgi:hypothetical protein